MYFTIEPIDIYPVALALKEKKSFRIQILSAIQACLSFLIAYMHSYKLVLLSCKMYLDIMDSITSVDKKYSLVQNRYCNEQT